MYRPRKVRLRSKTLRERATEKSDHGIAGCWARAVMGQAAAAIPLMKTRRRMPAPQARDHTDLRHDYSRKLRQAKRASMAILRSSNPWERILKWDH